MKKIDKMLRQFADLCLFDKFLLLAPLVVWFSYQPNIYLGHSSAMNIELSLVLIYVAVLAVTALPLIFSNYKKLLQCNLVRITGLFILWSFISIVWSNNLSRAILTTGVGAALFTVLLGVLSTDLKKLTPILKNTYIASAAFMSVLAIIQVAYGAWLDWGLCRGCLAAGFGFVRPSVFAIEPQFFGSLLLAPILILAAKFLRKTVTKTDVILLCIMVTAMYLTLSRGAIFSLVIAIACLMFLYRNSLIKKSRLAFLPLVVLAGFGVGMVWHGIFTEINPRVSDGFYDSVSKSVNQLTLGKINLPKLTASSASQAASPSTASVETNHPKAHFSGYVETSTSERTSMLNLALQTWRKDWITALFGTGTGSTGRAIQQHTRKLATEAEITQNQYIEILLENGLIGTVLCLMAVVLYLYDTRRDKLAWAILIAFALQWNFFSGLPNALHIYLVLAVIFAAVKIHPDALKRSVKTSA